MKRVQCIETDKVFESVKQAAETYGISENSVYRACKTGGYVLSNKMPKYVLDVIGNWNEKQPIGQRVPLHFTYGNAGYEMKVPMNIKVKCIETGDVFKNIDYAAAAIGSTVPNLYWSIIFGEEAHNFKSNNPMFRELSFKFMVEDNSRDPVDLPDWHSIPGYERLLMNEDHEIYDSKTRAYIKPRYSAKLKCNVISLMGVEIPVSKLINERSR